MSKKSAYILELQDYIDSEFNGNKSAFARAFGRTPQNVNKLFANPGQWVVIELPLGHILSQTRAVRKLKAPF